MLEDFLISVRKDLAFFLFEAILCIVKDPAISANNLNHDLDIIQQWAYQWKMEFNLDPTKRATEVLFSCKKSSPNHPRLIFNGIAVAKANDQKHLSGRQIPNFRLTRKIGMHNLFSRNYVLYDQMNGIQLHATLELLSIPKI